MTDQNTPNQNTEGEGAEANKHTQSRRALLASIGAGATGLALGGLTGTASASGSSAGEFIDSTSPATTATSDGNWSDNSIWDNGTPSAGQTVRIDSGVTLTVDTTTEKIKNLDVAGTLEFATDTDSHLRVETLVTRPDSTMEIGTEANPIQQGTEARITIVHHEDISEKDDPNRISKGIITMGEFTVHGAEKTSWDELATAPEAGDTTIELASAPTNWNEGDEIVIPGLDPSENEDDERTIASISGATVELDEPLEYDHVPPENNLDVELTAYALNCTRNVRFESEIKEDDVTNEKRINRQGHLMIMKPAQSISYLEVDHFGRTNKNFWMPNKDYSDSRGDNRVHGHGTEEPSEPNIIARYGLHFHETGIGEDPHEVTGVAVQHSPGWGVVNHSSHANVRESITYDVFGAGFVAEAGTERGVFKRCFALRSEGSKNTGRIYNAFKRYRGFHAEMVDFGHEGEGFWLQGPRVAVDDCVAAGHASYAFSLWAESLDGKMPAEFIPSSDPDPPQDLPMKSFSNNTAFAASGGFDYGNANAHSLVETFTVYNIGPTIDNSSRNYPASNNKPPETAQTHQPRSLEAGEVGNCCISVRYSLDLKVKNPQFCNVDGESGHGPDGYNGHGIRRNSWVDEESGGVYGGVMEGLNVGVQVTLEPWEEEIKGVSFYDNRVDIKFPTTMAPDPWHDSPANLDIYPGTKVGFFVEETDDIGAGPEVGSKPTGSEWDGGRGVHEFTVPGEYEYEYMYYGWGTEPGQGEKITGPITVSEDADAELPLAAFDYHMPSTDDGDITFDASPSTTSDSITSYEWDFGDGTTGSGKRVEHSFGESGDYTVELTVTTEDGSSHTASENVTVPDETVTVAPGGLEFSPADLEINPRDTVAFEWDSGGHTVTVDSQPDDASWSGVDSIQSAGYIHTHTFDVPGTYDYHCSVHPDMHGTITVNAQPEDVENAGLFDADLWRSSGPAVPSSIGVSQSEDAVAFSYELGHWNGTWNYTMTALTNDEIQLDWEYSGQHAEAFKADAVVRVFAGGTETTLVNRETLDGFSLSGTTTISVSAGETVRVEITVYTHSRDGTDHGELTISEASSSGGSTGDSKKSDADKTVTVAPDANAEFSPADLQIDPGETVAFEWDSGGHTVTVDSQPDDANWSGVDSTQSEGHTLTHTFDVEGTYDYYCQPHQSQMQGTITVGDADEPESVSEAIDENDDGDIDDDEILDALDHWQDEEPVPGTGGETISDQEILDLVDSWQDEDSG